MKLEGKCVGCGKIMDVAMDEFGELVGGIHLCPETIAIYENGYEGEHILNLREVPDEPVVTH